MLYNSHMDQRVIKTPPNIIIIYAYQNYNKLIMFVSQIDAVHSDHKGKKFVQSLIPR